MVKKILILGFCCLFSAFLYGQQNSLPAVSSPFNEETWRKATQKMSRQRAESQVQQQNEQQQNANGKSNEKSTYQTKEKREEYVSEQKRYNIEDKYKETPKPKENKGISGGESAMKTLVIIIGTLLLAFIIYYFLGGLGAKNRRLKNKEDLEAELIQVEENLPTANVETPLEKAIRSEEYKIATRLYYLLVIQKLSQKGFIKWRKDKTNREYQNEIFQRSFAKKFGVATLQYEKVWFGKDEYISKERFDENKNTFDELLNEI